MVVGDQIHGLNIEPCESVGANKIRHHSPHLPAVGAGGGGQARAQQPPHGGGPPHRDQLILIAEQELVACSSTHNRHGLPHYPSLENFRLVSLHSLSHEPLRRPIQSGAEERRRLPQKRPAVAARRQIQGPFS